MTLAKRRSGAADQPEHHVFGRHAERELALDSHREVASSRLRQALGRQHELDLGCADAKRQSAKCSMSGGMRVAADDQHPGLRQAELGTDDVHDALAPAADLMQRDAFAPAVLRQHLHLLPRQLVRGPGAPSRGDVVVHGRHAQIGPADAPPRQAQALESLRRGDLVHEVQVDIKEVGFAGRCADYVRIPELLG